MMLFKNILNKIKKIYHLKILKRKYYRLGACAKCGACCRNIYVWHKSSVIKSKEEFEQIKNSDSYSFYHHIKPIDVDDFGLIFKCEKYSCLYSTRAINVLYRCSNRFIRKRKI